MGKFLLILMFGLSISTGIIVISKNRQLIDSNELVVEHFSNISTKNAANSGAFIALNQLYLDDTWRPNYGSPLVLNTDTIYIAVQDTAVPANQLKINTAGLNYPSQSETEVMVFDADFHDFAVWAKDSVDYVTASDSLGNVDSSLVIEHAPFMPYIDYASLVNQSVLQGHIYSGHTHISDGYPNGNFYYSGLTPNVTWVDGDLHVQNNRTIYGIYIVEGETTFDENVTVEGIIYTPNTGTLITKTKDDDSIMTNINGGIITWGGVDGAGYQIYVDHEPEYMRALASNYAPNNPRMRVLTWK